MRFIADHWETILLIAVPVWGAAVNALSEPTPTSNKFYAWFYAFSHALKLNFPQAACGTKMALK